jgi:hypothetical protein
MALYFVESLLAAAAKESRMGVAVRPAGLGESKI